MPCREEDEHVYKLNKPKLDKLKEPCEKAQLEMCLAVFLVKDFCWRRTAVNVQTIKARFGDVASLHVGEAGKV